MSSQVSFQPFILSRARCPVIIVIILVRVCCANVAIRPGSIQNIESGGPSIKGIPGAGMRCRARPIQAAIGFPSITPPGGGDRPVLWPGYQVRMECIRTRHTMIPHAWKDRDRRTRHFPKGGSEDRAGVCSGLDKIAEIPLVAAGITVIAGSHCKAGTA